MNGIKVEFSLEAEGIRKFGLSKLLDEVIKKGVS